MLPAVLAALLALASAEKRYVIVSSPSQADVFYWLAPSFERNPEEAQVAAVTANSAAPGALTDPSITPMSLKLGLTAPVGLAVDQSRGGLYVADPEEQKIYRFNVRATATGLEVGEKKPIVNNIAARWVAVDAVGTLFFSDEQSNLIYKVDAKDLVEPISPTFMSIHEAYKDEPVSPTVLYDGANVAAVSSPGGVAVDNFRVFWANKGFGTQVGSVVQGYEQPSAANPTAVTPIALNAIKVYGVCISSSNVYFTAEDKKTLYGVKKMGGAIATVSEKMAGPRGCAWDGDGTVYVADEAGSKVWSFPANMKSLSPQRLDEAFTVQSPSGIAVFTVSFAPVAVVAALFALLS